jgi:hypothetical protein
MDSRYLEGYLFIFDPDLKSFTNFIKIPNWKTKGIFGSMVWAMEFDNIYLYIYRMS